MCVNTIVLLLLGVCGVLPEKLLRNDAATPLTGSGGGAGSYTTHLGGISGSTASCQIVLLPRFLISKTILVLKG